MPPPAVAWPIKVCAQTRRANLAPAAPKPWNAPGEKEAIVNDFG
jgi:hypothetical protein